MADESLRYDKDNILAIPDLSIERHYESEGVIPAGEVPYEEPEKPDRYVETLDDLDRVYRLADLLPSDLGTIIKNITEVLSLDTQGKIILQFQEKPPEGSQPAPEPTPKPTGPEPTTTTPGESEPAQPKEVGVVDIFSREPAFTIEIERGRSLVDISRAAYKQDDSDIKEHYTSMMTQITNRFFQIMTTLAEEANMEDYTFLLQDFDGTAVTTNDPNQRHLIDTICKGQIIYDQKLRQMNLTHTAANTLCMTRGFHAAEMQRERYLQEQYKTDMPDMTSSFSNDLLEASRSEATKKYKQAAYNQYKYLDNAVKDTNSLLNIKIDEASAKAQLSNTGSDIFAFTPPPPPTENHIDDNYEATQASQKSAQDAINNSQKDAITGAQAAAGGGTSGTSSGGGGGDINGYHGMPIKGTGIDTLAFHPNPPGSGVERWAPYVVDALVANGVEPTDDRVARILRQIDTESSGDPGVDQQIQDVNSGGNEARGLMQIIPSTFDAHSFSNHTDPYNGYDSLLAGIHYIIGRYGIDSPEIGVPGKGY